MFVRGGWRGEHEDCVGVAGVEDWVLRMGPGGGESADAHRQNCQAKGVHHTVQVATRRPEMVDRSCKPGVSSCSVHHGHSSEERIRVLPSAMENGVDQSAKKARLELVLPNAPVTQEIVPAKLVPTMEVCVKMDLTVLHCPICFCPFKPPVFQCNGGHVACSGCRGEGELPRNQCQKCEHGGDFDVHNTAMDAVVPSAMTECQYDGCGLYVTYNKAGDHQSACPHAPCRCTVHGCGFVGTPRALLGHLNAVHSKPLLRIQYGKVLQLQGPVSEPWLLLLAEEDDCAFIVVGGSVGLAAPTAVSVVCIRAGA